MKKHRLPILLLFTAIIVTTIFAVIPSPASAAVFDDPLLYYNDTRWAREDKYPIKYIDGVYYIPLTVFAQLEDTTVRVNNKLNTFVISHSGLFVSFDASSNTATDQSDNIFEITTYKFDSNERYVPVKELCRRLGFGYDTYQNELNGKLAIRILDGTEELSFKTLLEIYNPSHLVTAEEVYESISESLMENISVSESINESVLQGTSVTTTEDEEEKPPERVLGNRIIYINISGIGANTGRILDVLLNQGQSCKATFFIDYDDITDYPLTLSRIISEGHKIGICPKYDYDIYANYDAFLQELQSTNELLFRVFKTSTRTVMPDSELDKASELYIMLDSEEFTKDGYSLWAANAVHANIIYDNDTASELMIEAIWDNNTVVFAFAENTQSAYVISKTLDFITKNLDKCDVRSASAYYTPQN